MLNTFVLLPASESLSPASDDLDFFGLLPGLLDEFTDTPKGSSLWFPPASVYGWLIGAGDERDDRGRGLALRLLSLDAWAASASSCARGRYGTSPAARAGSESVLSEFWMNVSADGCQWRNGTGDPVRLSCCCRPKR